MMCNPTYSEASIKPHPYTSHGPRDTPPNNSPSNLTAESVIATYDIIGSPVADRHAPSRVLKSPPAGRGRGLEEGDYEEVEGEEEGGGEGEYHVLGEIGGEGETYEVPVSSKTTVQPATTEYSHYSTSNTRYDTGHSLIHKCVEHTITSIPSFLQKFSSQFNFR